MALKFPDKIEHNNPNLKLMDDKWVNYETEDTSRTIYISNAGSDTTGDGSIGNPYATFTKALSTIKLHISSDVTITIHAVAGTYSLTSDDLGIISLFGGAGTLAIEGELELVDSGFTMGAADPNDPLTYNVSGGNTGSWIVNQWKYYFLKSGTNYIPITHNTTTSLSITRNLTGTEIYQIKTTINLESSLNFQITFILKFLKLILPNISFNKLFTSSSLLNEFNSCHFYCISNTVLNLTDAYGGWIRHSFFQNVRISSGDGYDFYYNYFYSNVNLILFEDRRGNNRSNVFENPNTGSNSGCVYLNIGGENGGLIVYTGYYYKFINSNVAFIDYGMSISYNSFENLIIINTNFLIRKSSNYSNVPNILLINNVYGSINTRWFYDSMYEFVNIPSGKNIQITGILYPEYESNTKYTWNNNTSGNVVVGKTTQNYSIEITYTIARGTLREQGKLRLTNAADALIDREQVFDDCGVTFGKNISGTDIQLTYIVDASGNNASVTFTEIKRVMITPLTI